MRKRQKLKKMIGAVICFNVHTPYSGEGELYQHTAIRVESVRKAKNGAYYVGGLAIKRLQSSERPEYRQYQIDRIQDRTIAVITDNEWTQQRPQLRRVTMTRKLPIHKIQSQHKPLVKISGDEIRRRLQRQS